MDEDFPDKCPVCRKVANNILLHINKKESCKDKVSPELYAKWKNEGNKRKKRKYQEKYVESGKHKIAKANYVQKCVKSDEKSFLQVQRHNRARHYNKEKILSGNFGNEKRKEAFKNLCKECLWNLKQGKIPSSWSLNRFHLVESTILSMDSDQLHAWLKDVESGLLLKVIAFQKIVLVPESTWLTAIQAVDDSPDKKEMKDRLFNLICNLQAYGNENTMKISVPMEYLCQFNPNVMNSGYYPMPENFTDEDEIQLDKAISNIIGKEEEIINDELEGLLKITKDMETVNEALFHTKWTFEDETQEKEDSNSN